MGTLDSLTYGFVGARNITSLALDSQGEAGACRGTRARCGCFKHPRTQGASRLGGWERAAGPGHAGVELQRDIRERPGGREVVEAGRFGVLCLDIADLTCGGVWGWLETPRSQASFFVDTNI